MPRISTDNYDTVASWNGSQDLFVVEQSDGTKVATPAMVKQYVLNDMDEVPTQNSNDTVKSGGVFSAVDDVYSVMGQMGAKNLIPYPYVNTSQTINNVAFTVSGDGSISVDNVASAITQFRLYGWTTGLSPLLLRKGTYILSGCPSGGGVNSLRLYLHNQDSSITIADDGEGTQFTLSDDTYVGIAIRVANGYDADGKNVYPMLRLASDTDNTYEPYAMTNKQLTDQLETKQDTLTFDNVPTENSDNPVKSGGIFSAIANLITHVAGETSITIPLSDSWTATIFGTISTTPISAILTVVSGGSVSVTDLTSNSLASKANISANVSNKTITLTSKNTDKFYVNIVK